MINGIGKEKLLQNTQEALDRGSFGVPRLVKIVKQYVGEQEWHSGESTRLPPMWPGFDSQTRRRVG